MAIALGILVLLVIVIATTMGALPDLRLSAKERGTGPPVYFDIGAMWKNDWGGYNLKLQEGVTIVLQDGTKLDNKTCFFNVTKPRDRPAERRDPQPPDDAPQGKGDDIPF